MKTFDLSKKEITVEELLKKAADGAVRILSAYGQAFVLEEAADFEKRSTPTGKEQEIPAIS